MAKAALFFHLVGAFLFVGGIVVAGVAHASARRRERPAEIALLLGLARTGVLLVALGALLVLVFGFWLVGLRNHSLREAWLLAALVLFFAAFALGALGGRRPRHARLLAARLAPDEADASGELRRLLDDRASAFANALAALALAATLALMVWRPGA